MTPLRTRLTAGLVLAPTLALDACCGGLSKAAWVKKVEAVCTSAEAQFKSLGEAPTDESQLGPYFQKFQGFYDDQVKKIKAIGLPDDGKAAAQDFQTKLDALGGDLTKLQDAITKKDTSALEAAGKQLETDGDAADTAAKNAGLSNCADETSS